MIYGSVPKISEEKRKNQEEEKGSLRSPISRSVRRLLCAAQVSLQPRRSHRSQKMTYKYFCSGDATRTCQQKIRTYRVIKN